MLIAFAGSTNKGKSTLFAAVTLVDVEISDRPFTTIDPNKGVAFVRTKCPCKEFNTKCNPKNSKCEEGVRLVPINVIDIAGLVPGAHLGKGLGNKFLDDIRTADVLIQVIDVSGKTDEEGNPTEAYDPANEIIFLEDEIAYWISGILRRGWDKVRSKGIEGIAEILTGLKVTKEDIVKAISELRLKTERIDWSEEETLEFARKVREIAMPIIIAANKIDIPGAKENYKKLIERFPDKIIIPTYADGELALRKAASKGIINYVPGEEDFEENKVNEKQKEALERIRSIMKENNGTGVQKIIDKAVFELLKLIVVYPVSDENKLTDHFGAVLPDAILVRQGTTAIEFARQVHEDLAKNFINAIDARKKLRVGKDHVLKDGDIIRIVAGK